MKTLSKGLVGIGIIAILSTVVHDYIFWRDYSQLITNIAMGGVLIAFGWIYNAICKISMKIRFIDDAMEEIIRENEKTN